MVTLQRPSQAASILLAVVVRNRHSKCLALTSVSHIIGMNRLFGSKTQKQKPTLTDVATNVDERNETVEKKIARLDAEIRKLAQQAAKMREGPAKNAVKMKALRLLKQKKVYERQSEQLANQSFNISQTDFTIRSLQDTKTTISAMKAGSKAMKKEMKNINVDQIYDITDDLADMMDVANEVQDALGENYATPDVDEAELEDELANLGDDLGVDSGYLDQALDAPSVPSTSLPGENVPAATPGAKSTVDSREPSPRGPVIRIASRLDGLPNS